MQCAGENGSFDLDDHLLVLECVAFRRKRAPQRAPFWMKKRLSGLKNQEEKKDSSKQRGQGRISAPHQWKVRLIVWTQSAKKLRSSQPPTSKPFVGFPIPEGKKTRGD